MTEDYVSFEQAVKLKELGFYWSCNMYYATQNYCEGNNPYDFDTICTGDLISSPRMKEDENDGWIEDEDYCVPAPTLAQAQKWLREVKQIIVIPCVMYVKDILKYDFYIVDEPLDVEYDFEGFDTYEQALSEGLDQAIKLLKTENNENT